MIPLTNEEKKYTVGKKNCHIVKKDSALMMIIKGIIKSEIVVTTQENIDSLLIALDLCQNHYQVLLYIYQKDFIVITAQIVNLILTIFQSMIID